jgi:hypothetical protein
MHSHNHSSNSRIATLLAILFVIIWAILISGCGGGSEDSTPDQTIPTSPCINPKDCT